MAETGLDRLNDTGKNDHGHRGVRVAAIVLVLFAAWLAGGGWDLFASNVSQRTQDIAVYTVVGIFVSLVAAGAYVLVNSYLVSRSLRAEAARLKAARKETEQAQAHLLEVERGKAAE